MVGRAETGEAGSVLLPHLQQHADAAEHAAFADGDSVAHAFGGSGLDVDFGGRGGAMTVQTSLRPV